eukprot:Skav229571  [mRNA]  locus=scaffold568:673830:686456:+ [translate_table: standard]
MAATVGLGTFANPKRLLKGPSKPLRSIVGWLGPSLGGASWSSFHRLFLLRVLRPDRIGAALSQFVQEGAKGTAFHPPRPPMPATPHVPDPGNTDAPQDWLKSLERSLELIEEFVHPDFRCIKIADEAPTDLKSNLRRAYAKFSQDGGTFTAPPEEAGAQQRHLPGRSQATNQPKTGLTLGWSKKYPFNDGDLTICAQAHRLDSDVPWPDIRYIFGEIMYGGHITDQWDRRVCNTYLLTLVLPELLSNMNLAPGFKSPDASKMEYSSYQKRLGDCSAEGLPG